MEMIQEFYDLSRDLGRRRRWWLDTPRNECGEPLDVWAFTAGRLIAITAPLRIPIERSGDIMDLTFSHTEIPYVQPRIGRIFDAFSANDIQRIPAHLETGEEIEILNVLT